MKKIVFLVLITFLMAPSFVFANRGCCSWHGGISHCGNNGYYICNDGSQSPSCTCSFDSSYIISDTSCDSYEDEIEDLKYHKSILESKNEALENENDKLEADKHQQQTKLENYQFLFWSTLIIFIIYFIYKNSKDDKQKGSIRN